MSRRHHQEPSEALGFKDSRWEITERFIVAAKKVQQKPVTYKWVSKFLENRADDLEVLREMARNRRPPHCFYGRCDRILVEMRAHILVYKKIRSEMQYAHYLMEMYAMIIGALTLDSSGRDEEADHADSEVTDMTDEIWEKCEKLHDRTIDASRADLDGFWLRLNWPIDGCCCAQCEKLKYHMYGSR
ncbi:hypothetical protein PENSTE_c023G06067 [Penicillium steckii]|uniref:Uncharacterized protein n=1 Tax=Penicillium steckii TaxID=303698 RepID=A0A1V6SSH0_9EURO|nr:hypothetical protein PENSTE_c023G06067 [Penicillium steckii]